LTVSVASSNSLVAVMVFVAVDVPLTPMVAVPEIVALVAPALLDSVSVQMEPVGRLSIVFVRVAGEVVELSENVSLYTVEVTGVDEPFV
jgi:hypothetical protein